MEDSKKLWAFITKSNEPNMVQPIGTIIDGQHYPMISTRRDLIELMRPVAINHGKQLNQKVWLREYEFVKDEEIL